MLPGSSKLRITSSIGENSNYPINGPELTLWAWNRIEISQTRNYDGSYKLSSKLNGEIFSTVSNSEARSYQNLKIYTAGPHFDPAMGKVDRIHFWSLPEGSSTTVETEETISGFNGKEPVVLVIKKFLLLSKTFYLFYNVESTLFWKF